MDSTKLSVIGGWDSTKVVVILRWGGLWLNQSLRHWGLDSTQVGVIRQLNHKDFYTKSILRLSHTPKDFDDCQIQTFHWGLAARLQRL